MDCQENSSTYRQYFLLRDLVTHWQLHISLPLCIEMVTYLHFATLNSRHVFAAMTDLYSHHVQLSLRFGYWDNTDYRTVSSQTRK